jgi:hypothetical protein
MPVIRRGDHRDMLALSVVIQESLYSMGQKLKSAFWHTTLQRPHLVRERNGLGLLRELDDGEHSSAQTLSPRSIYSVRHGADRRRHTPHFGRLSHKLAFVAEACCSAREAQRNCRRAKSREGQLLEKWGNRSRYESGTAIP